MASTTDENLVEPQDACPSCGERDTDRLIWLDDERVECQACGTTYEPGDRQRDRALAHIARDVLGIQTLGTRNSDRLDFHDVGVAGLREALRLAWAGGAKVSPLLKVLGAAEALLGARAIEGITPDDWALLERALREATQRDPGANAGSA